MEFDFEVFTWAHTDQDQVRRLFVPSIFISTVTCHVLSLHIHTHQIYSSLFYHTHPTLPHPTISHRDRFKTLRGHHRAEFESWEKQYGKRGSDGSKEHAKAQEVVQVQAQIAASVQATLQQQQQHEIQIQQQYVTQQQQQQHAVQAQGISGMHYVGIGGIHASLIVPNTNTNSVGSLPNMRMGMGMVPSVASGISVGNLVQDCKPNSFATSHHFYDAHA